MYLPTPELQKAVLKNIHEQIEDGGILTLNIFDPFPEYQTSQMASSPDDY